MVGTLADAYDPRCVRCSLSAWASSVCVPGRGNPDGRLLVLGEAPGAKEDERNSPFVGPAGELLDEALAEAGLAERAFRTNVVKCRPPRNREPEHAEREACRMYLELEFDRVRPLVALALGSHALASLVPLAGTVSRSRGKWIAAPMPGLEQGCWVVPTWHPAYVLRRRQIAGPEFADDLATVRRAFAEWERSGYVASVYSGRSACVGEEKR